MISVAEATDRLLALVDVLPSETVPLRAAATRVLAQDLAARASQPPFAASAMDGYAVTAADAPPGDRFRVVGEAAAGRPFAGDVGPGEAVRIFTGAPLPEGCTRVIIQEDVTRDGDRITLGARLDPGPYVRQAGGDFAAGSVVSAPRRLGSRDVALLAAMGHAEVPVARRPEIAILMTGDELRPPGSPLSPGQITASNGYGLAAMVEAEGARARLLPIAADRDASLRHAFALAAGADLLVTIGGASVGDHDLVAPVAAEAGLDLAFHKVAMRPGKPLLAGRMPGMALVGVPGNPVSSMVCGVIFILPMIRRMLGLDPVIAMRTLPLAGAIAANGDRRHYMRATLGGGAVRVCERQDSSLLSVLAQADVLVVRPPRDAARSAGDLVEVVDLPR